MPTKLAEIQQMNQIPTYVVEVVANRQIAPRMRRVTVGGKDLARFQPKGPDQFLYLLLPPPGMDELTVDTEFTWTGFRRMPKEQRPVGAYYTVRHHRPDQNEIDLDMVLHESHDPDRGHAARWASEASPGDPLALWGPRICYEPGDSVTDVYAFVDETGLPAACCLAESLPKGRRAHLFIEVDGPEDELPVPASEAVTVTWLHRKGRAPGSTDLLESCAQQLAAPDPVTTYVYGGAESRAMKAIRKYVRRNWKLPKEAVSLVPYWRRDDSD